VKLIAPRREVAVYMRPIAARNILLLSLLVSAGGFSLAAPKAQVKPAPKPTAPSPAILRDSEIARGRYLVEEVARCSDCHTPRDSHGALDRSEWLRGASISIMPVQSKEAWAMRAPALAGLPYSDQQAQDILERGIGTNGNPIQPPMHAYHLHHEDASAIIAYLRSLSHVK
jgi:mono/diheme cytochrome c family protein